MESMGANACPKCPALKSTEALHVNRLESGPTCAAARTVRRAVEGRQGRSPDSLSLVPQPLPVSATVCILGRRKMSNQTSLIHGQNSIPSRTGLAKKALDQQTEHALHTKKRRRETGAEERGGGTRGKAQGRQRGRKRGRRRREGGRKGGRME